MTFSPRTLEVHRSAGTLRSVCSLCEAQKPTRSSDERRKGEISFDSHQALSLGTHTQHVTDRTASN